ncbi:DUF2177 family protein [Rhodoplanes sp. Z2-YC6860]|uniref:DUF2177 family protein n=1 Tax=Rhodoplanes sp. Z2-YC6860 TaxID=674703 RepID=UPI00078C9BE0|nr:DUF2177 family protein [Rhodoplanes sp. Z2-YC6860]AMN40819.1 putative membrane protein [Rhodoplanes sp. Z2-YC6860]
MRLVVSYLVTFLVFTVVDLSWLSIMGPALYRPTLGDILLPDLRLAPAAAFYLIFPIGIVAFAVNPAVNANSIATAIGYGFLFGVLAYATYDLTNFATLRNWTFQITILDMVYGGFASAFAAALTTLALRRLL